MRGKMSPPTELPGPAGLVRRRIRGFLLRRSPFFKAFPYLLPVYIGSANHRGVVSVSGRFFFNRVPKAANSSIVNALASGPANLNKTARIEQIKDDLTKPSQLSKAQVSDFRDFYKFTVVRNPFSRTLSAYLDLIVSRGYYKKLCLGSFEEFLKFIENGGLHKNIHWAPQTSFLLLPVDAFDLVGRFEALEPTLKEIADRTGIPIDMAQASHRPHATGAREKLGEYYSDYAINTVRKLFANDFVKLGYSREFPE